MKEVKKDLEVQGSTDKIKEMLSRPVSDFIVSEKNELTKFLLNKKNIKSLATFVRLVRLEQVIDNERKTEEYKLLLSISKFSTMEYLSFCFEQVSLLLESLSELDYLKTEKVETNPEDRKDSDSDIEDVSEQSTTRCGIQQVKTDESGYYYFLLYIIKEK